MAEHSLTQNSTVLYRASLEHIEAAQTLLEADVLPLAIYVAGLAVECVLQAVAKRHRPHSPHDARHDLDRWLRKCPVGLQDTMKSPPIRSHWNRIYASWKNSHRYLSREGLLRVARRDRMLLGRRGDDDARLRGAVREIVASARVVHRKGVAAWNFTNS